MLYISSGLCLAARDYQLAVNVCMNLTAMTEGMWHSAKVPMCHVPAGLIVTKDAPDVDH